jgi:hypothetical protein
MADVYWTIEETKMIRFGLWKYLCSCSGENGLRKHNSRSYSTHEEIVTITWVKIRVVWRCRKNGAEQQARCKVRQGQSLGYCQYF